MSNTEIQQVLEQRIREALDRHAAALRADLSEALRGLPETGAPAPRTGQATQSLNAALGQIHEALSQGEILRALLDGAARFSGRCALFVLRASTLTGWQSRGFDAPEGIRALSLDATTGLAGRAIRDKEPAMAAASEFAESLAYSHGVPAGGNAVVLPLLMRGKPAAVLYADPGTITADALDVSALHILTRATGVWLEVVSLRKTTPETQEAVPAVEQPTSQMPVPATTPEPAPMAYAAAAAAEVPVYVPAPQPPAYVAPDPEQAPAQSAEEAASAPAAVAVAVQPAAEPPVEDEVHRKARRFARLLVDEIKLYNREQVEKGRAARDLYTRLRDDIEKSRASYERRFGNTDAGGADYFTAELVRILADNDASLLGDSFPR